MDKTGIDWQLYRSFLGVLTEGSLSGAPRALGTTQPTVGRHVEALEKAFGTTLFTRSPTGLLPTDAAHELRPFAQAMHSHAAALERAAAKLGDAGDIRGVVRVSCSEVVGVEVLPPVIAQLCAAHPGLRVELVLTDRLQDLLQREADIAVRMARPAQEQLLARRDAELVRVLPERVAFPLECWITMHEDLRRRTPHRTTFDALVRAMLAHAGA
jgi:DNA-binding transcriptional LysR family regulator